MSDLGSITEDILSHAEENEEDLWVVSYADMVTLLFGFFVILYSFSTLDEKKFAEMAESVAQSFKDDKMPQKELDDVVIRDKKARAFDQLVAILNIAKTPQEALEKVEDKAHYRNQHLLVQGVMEQFVRDNGQELSQVFKPFVSQDAFSEIIIPAVWLFEKGRSEILPLADEKLQSLAQKIRLLPDVVEIDIVGHTDSSLPPRGTPFKDNLTLSSMRAGVVAASFIRYGIPPHMISIRGMGDLRPLVPERDDDGHFIPENQAKNRRVHIVLKKRSNPMDLDTLKLGLWGRRQDWRTWFSLNGWLTVIFGFWMIVTISCVVFFGMHRFLEHKARDAWTILYLRMQDQGRLLADALQKAQMVPDEFDAVLRMESDERIIRVEKGPFLPEISLLDVGLNPNGVARPWPSVNLLEVHGEIFLGRIGPFDEKIGDQGGRRLFLRRIPNNIFSPIVGAATMGAGVLYVLTREGRFLHTSDAQLDFKQIKNRPLYQEFLRSSLTMGQFAWEDREGSIYWGFYYEIPKTNIIMFYEIAKEALVHSVFKIGHRLIGLLVLMVCLSLLLVQWPLRKATAPLHTLVHLATRLAQKDFTSPKPQRGVGELNLLSAAMGRLTETLVLNEELKRSEMRTELKNLQSKGDADLASYMQEYFFPEHSKILPSGLEIASYYQASDSYGGDFYTYFYNPEVQETVILQADLSGHGVGTSMMTAILAGLFDQYRDGVDKAFPSVEFAQRANRVLWRLGKGRQHATMILIRHLAHSGRVDILFGGHRAALLYHSSEDGGVNEKSFTVHKASQPLGLSDNFPIIYGEYIFTRGSRLILYSNGFVAAQNPSGEEWGLRHMRHVVGQKGDMTALETRDALVREWRFFRGEETLSDDACVLVLRAS